ncbi:MAG: nicotinate-nucleotide--dimethylbenzimidazole phosphoribosyltransferase [Thalassolituus sp.]|jgi:nicotinate-nucleotide--dimethylbenzimidazole phosphoribosyltransferase|uniref:nicotinate-nucleotide--dimethylbenzimidazole phosphoribosyltransferase n=1 Tax=Thalassolituus sp. TaxID=2030822 RepID=UPI0023B4DFEE|nr:nicotinate-nucleotide--dimethylbenzimidazole phosphoribosyltransferase [Thalassolituus sp.]MDQ4424843.1 nicotinate-nucleotide--dimethylbenzimidazole phosphoribosyltransferase [Thalassolituus sp.]MDQ4426703.1 nicotinate-nucleotide--dimethylbenzimidazole phosphoribosyltransferase [Thalassolituus sp.]|tara:strand:- start:4401 stop:5447 length:1047 start_codon:yes stop_codon:yes gene_type:complete
MAGVMFSVSPVSHSRDAVIQQRIDMKTKPPGSLGRLESLAAQLAAITGVEKIRLHKPVMIVFAADHGIAEEGVSIAPAAVTQQMVKNFIDGGAAVNCFCQVASMSLYVVDAGILNAIESGRVINQRLGAGTDNIAKAPAMSRETAESGLTLGADVVRQRVAESSNVFAFGEMGIGNTSAASAVLAAILGRSVEETCGRGTGIDDDAFERKKSLIAAAFERHQATQSPDDTINILASLGGFEIVQMTGAMLAAAEQQCVIMVDGFIASVAALAAVRIAPEARDYMVFCHHSEEQAHSLILEALDAEPLLDLGLRLGEGTGAALAYPLLQSAQSFYNYMASFDDAGIAAV